MRAAISNRNGAQSAPVTDNEERGKSIERRRLALGINSLREFEDALEHLVRRDTLSKVEDGTASEGTYRKVEAWLEREERENGHTAQPPADGHGPIKLTLHGVYGVDELIIEGPVEHPEALAEAVGRILEEFRKGER